MEDINLADEAKIVYEKTGLSPCQLLNRLMLYMKDTPEETEIDELRLKCFKTNSEEDKVRLQQLLLKWFHDRTWRRCN